MNVIDMALEELSGGPCVVMLKAKVPAVREMAMPVPPGAPPQINIVVVEENYRFQAEHHRRVGDGWEFRVKERSAENKMVAARLFVRTDEILMVRAVSALESGAA